MRAPSPPRIDFLRGVTAALPTGGAGAALADAIARVDGMFEEHVLRPVRAAGRWGGLGRAMGYDPGRGSDRARA